MPDTKAECLFEVSWEVCNKVGGIYTVISSKAAQMNARYKSYYCVGPYVSGQAAAELQHMPVPENLQKIFDSLKEEDIECYFGAWQVKGKPNAILIDFSKFMNNKNAIKAYLWDKFKIDSLTAGNDFDEPVVWGWAAGRLIEKVIEKYNWKTVVHCHEWLSGGTLLYLKDKKLKAATVFTTHATILGRTVAGAERPLYEILEHIDTEGEARNYNIQAKHGMEKECARLSDAFTTVSEITALEAEHLLGRKADAILPNGIDFASFPDLEDVPLKHKLNKNHILEFILPYFFPYYSFNVDNTLFFYLSGRYEFTNKGIDVFIASLGELNRRMKEEKSKMTVVAFLFVPAGVKVPKLSIIESKNIYEDIQDEVGHYLQAIQNKILYAVVSGVSLSEANLFEDEFLYDIKKFNIAFKKDGIPPVCTHELQSQSDAILHNFGVQDLRNLESDRVKVILYPVYLRSSDGIMDMDYYNVVSGCHLGVFPSYYEPWGYTPLESAAYGVPSITTDLAGFGLHVQKILKKDEGIYVIKRRGMDFKSIVSQLCERFYWYVNLPKNLRIKNKVMAEHISRQLDWSKLAIHYIDAHDKAMEKWN